LGELAAFFPAAKTPSHRIAFMLLGYTGQRVKEIRSLVWGDFTWGEQSFVSVRETTTKDRKKRPIPLHPG
jgi:integrase